MSLLRVPDDGSDLAVTPFFGANFELMTPELPIPTAPRLFIGGEVVAAFGFERAVAGEGDPGALACPLSELACSSTRFNEDVALGQGSEVVATLDRVIYGAYAGIAFPFELYGRQLRVKTSVAWIRYQVGVTGLIVDAECRPVGELTNCNTNTAAPRGFLREIRLEGSGSGTFDGIGPGLDFELDTGRFGPVGSSIFLGARAYYILGERTVSFNDAASYDDLLTEPPIGTGVPDQTRAQWSFEADQWMYRVGLGIRFQWLGFAD